MLPSPFIDRPELWTGENETAYSVPVTLEYAASKGHTLVFAKRITTSPFDLTEIELTDIFRLAQQEKQRLDKLHSPEAYNLGWNVGEVAGQTVSHAHFHIIPRYQGDHPDPRGGIVKNLLPTAPNYYRE